MTDIVKFGILSIMLSSTINNLIRDLKPRQKEILAGRFGLVDGEKRTLANLGEKYDITRERVRQIEEEALKLARERLAEEKAIKQISDTINSHLRGLGGIRKDDLFIQEVKTLLNDKNLHHWHLRFLSETLSSPLFYPADDNFHDFWYLDEKTISLVDRFISRLEKLISDKKDDLIFYKKFNDYFGKAAKIHNLPEHVGLNYLLISQRFGTNAFGDWGLNDWEEINPKTVREKAYLVLKKQEEPLHFRDIADVINKANFGGRLAHPQTVHNELIKDPRFILVGRGTYGLKERGFMPGTAREIISQILKKQGPLTPKEIIESVSRQRFLKENTIIINLHNKKYFKKIEDGRYSVK